MMNPDEIKKEMLRRVESNLAESKNTAWIPEAITLVAAVVTAAEASRRLIKYFRKQK